MKLKYIVIEDRGNEVPILFPVLLEHTKVAAGKEVISAGFVDINIGMLNEITFECYGKSIGLKIGSREEDSELVTRACNFPSRL